jgi:hypothetical protein
MVLRLRLFICTAIVAAGLVAVTPSLASAFTLNLAAPSPVVVGTPAILKATGTIDVEEIQFPYYFSLNAIPTSVMTTCPPDRWEAYQVAIGTGGSNIVRSQAETPDAAGNFSLSVGVTPSAPGSVLLCGYTDDGLTHTLAVAPLILNIQEPSSAQPVTTPTKPTAASIAAYVRAAIRSCKALLDGSGLRRCIRHAVLLENKECRRLRPRRKSNACLRAVRRVRRRES